VRLYGLLEGTLLGATNTSSNGAGSIGMPVSWFSGNRWGLDMRQRLSAPAPEGQKTPSNELNLIAKLESEFELPSGNMDTPGVLFNRDAWLGFESPAFGKFTIGRQNALPRDVAQTWGDPYGSSKISTNEGGFSNVNSFKQMIYYAGGGNGANGQGDTRYDAALVWKKLFPSGWFLAAGYNFGDGNGPGGPNGSGPIPGAYFNKGSSIAGGIGYNAQHFNFTGFYTSSNVLVADTIGTSNVGHQDSSFGIGGNYDGGLFRLNLGYMYYTGDQGAVLGRRFDNAWTVSTKISPTKRYDYEFGLQEFYAHNAAVNAKGYVLRPYIDATGATSTVSGSRFSPYWSFIMHPVPNVDLYLVGDDLLTGGNYLDSRANGSKHLNEYGSGVRFKF
jgi:predicted porin